MVQARVDTSGLMVVFVAAATHVHIAHIHGDEVAQGRYYRVRREEVVIS
jgi:hypothetical protein